MVFTKPLKEVNYKQSMYFVSEIQPSGSGKLKKIFNSKCFKIFRKLYVFKYHLQKRSLKD